MSTVDYLWLGLATYIALCLCVVIVLMRERTPQ